MVESKTYFKAFIRVVKSILDDNNRFSTEQVIREPLIEATSKKEVNEILLKKYPQFFQNNKIYTRETKDQAQFFYVIVYPLYNYELNLVNEGQWECSSCGQIHENKYISRPKINEKLVGPDKLFCPSDNEYHIKIDSINYIYKVTEKETGKCYIGKTKNAPFWRWWEHLTKSGAEFGRYLRETKLSNWTFEVLEEFPSIISDQEIFRIESEYMIKFNSINNGFNTVISCKKVYEKSGNLFDEL